MAFSIPKAKRCMLRNFFKKYPFIDPEPKTGADPVGPGAYNPKNLSKRNDPQWG
jgi:hypothetical protein